MKGRKVNNRKWDTEAPNLREVPTCSNCVNGEGYPEARSCELHDYPAGLHGYICDDYE